MKKDLKYSALFLALRYFGLYIIFVILNVLVFSSILGILPENQAWMWTVQILIILTCVGIFKVIISSYASKELLRDSAEEKKAARNDEVEYKPIYSVKKGFLAGALAVSPFAVLEVVWLVTKSPAAETLLRLVYSPFFQVMLIVGFNVLSAAIILLLTVLIMGLAYLSAKPKHKKMLTIIRRNEEKYKKTN